MIPFRGVTCFHKTFDFSLWRETVTGCGGVWLPLLFLSLHTHTHTQASRVTQPLLVTKQVKPDWQEIKITLIHTHAIVFSFLSVGRMRMVLKSETNCSWRRLGPSVLLLHTQSMTRDCHYITTINQENHDRLQTRYGHDDQRVFDLDSVWAADNHIKSLDMETGEILQYTDS